MHVLQAFDRFTRRTGEERRELLDAEITLRGVDAWPEAATAAASLSGMLDDANTDTELDEAISHFYSLYSAGVVSSDDWWQATAEVIRELLEWGEQQEVAADEGSGCL